MNKAALAIFTAGATREGIAALAPDFAHICGIALVIDTTHGHLILERALAGETEADVVILPSAMVDELVAAGRADAETRTRIGIIRIGAAVRDGVPGPDVSSMAALTRTLMAADSIVITEAPSGQHMERLFAELGLAEALAPRITRYDTGTMVNEHLVRSEATGEIAFGVATEILFFRNRGITYVGPLPEEAQMTHLYEAVMLTRSNRREAAGALMDSLGTPEARAAFAPTGVDPTS